MDKINKRPIFRSEGSFQARDYSSNNSACKRAESRSAQYGEIFARYGVVSNEKKYYTILIEGLLLIFGLLMCA